MLSRMAPDLPRLLERFDDAVELRRGRLDPTGPGFSAALVVDGRPARIVHHGLAHLEWPQPLAGDTRMYLGSEAKPWIAVLVMDAVAAGRIALDADLRATLPALAGYGQPVRLGHLLRHTSGIADYLFLWRMQLEHDEDDLVTQAQALALIRRADDVSFDPGARHDYSNSNYVLLAEWLQLDAGLSLDTLARRRFFEPWGLHDTSFELDPRRVLPRRARSYGRDAADAAWRERPVNLATWGDGGLWSTLDDLVRAESRWLDDWRHNGSRSLLARCTADDDQFGPAAHSYRFGLDPLAVGDRRLQFHGGGFAGFSSLILRCTEHGTAVIVLSNADGFDTSARTWTRHLWGEAAAPPSIALT